MIRQRLGHYRILEKIGAGGMGEVYRAEDLHLARDVAIKVLPAGTLADEQARRRFRKEAEALSKLNHPNIQTVHDFDTQGEVDFLVVEFVPGPTLVDKLTAGALPEKEIASLGSQIAAALEEAHERGVVHRDLKPGNIKVTPKGQVKVLDFGLAKLLKPVGPGFSQGTATTESFTETQAVAGTLPYMAPEQLRGEGVDHRSDIWAAGVVLYEMATERRPFEEKVATALTDDILHKPPPAPGRLKPDLSSRLEEIILKCLEKDPEDRYQSAKELAVDLRRLGAPAVVATPRREPRGSGARILRWGGVGFAGVVGLLAVVVGLNMGGLRERLLGAAGPPQIQSLAVLPLKNLMGDSEQEYFVEGMHEALITELSKISALKVISRTSTMRYKGTDKPLPQVARELNVDGVIEGSVLREGDQVRITVQLIHGPSDKHLWAQSFDRELRGILALQSEVARAIADQIKVALTPQEQAGLARAPTVNPAAYQAYLKGRYYWNKRTLAGLLKGIEYFQQALAQDPNSALAYVGLADSYNQLAYRGHLAPREAYPRAQAAALKALEIDKTLAEAHASLAFLEFNFNWNWAAAEREFQRTLELNSSYAEAHHWYSHYWTDRGRAEESLAETKRALEFDPLSLIVNVHLGWHYTFAGQYDQAIEQLQKTLEMDPGYYSAYLRLGQAYAYKGDYPQAIATLQKAGSLSGDSTEAAMMLAAAYGLAGQRADALGIVNELQKISQGTYVSSFSVAAIYAGLGDKNRALAWLEKAYEERASGLVEVKADPIFDPLRSDPRFQDLLRRMNFPE